jgi:hypothetical protein
VFLAELERLRQHAGAIQEICVSTISITIGRSVESRRIFALCI